MKSLLLVLLMLLEACFTFAAPGVPGAAVQIRNEDAKSTKTTKTTTKSTKTTTKSKTTTKTSSPKTNTTKTKTKASPTSPTTTTAPIASTKPTSSGKPTTSSPTPTTTTTQSTSSANRGPSFTNCGPEAGLLTASNWPYTYTQKCSTTGAKVRASSGKWVISTTVAGNLDTCQAMSQCAAEAYPTGGAAFDLYWNINEGYWGCDFHQNFVPCSFLNAPDSDIGVAYLYRFSENSGVPAPTSTNANGLPTRKRQIRQVEARQTA